MNPDKHTAPDPRAELIVSAVLVLLTLLVYSRSFHYPFVHYDDPDYILNNPHVLTGLRAANVRWAFTTFACSNWHPLTWLSLQLDATLFGGQNAGAFHRTNAVLHAANTLLLFLILSRWTGAVGRSAMVAGLFALHPLHVESVAWVSERKDVLSTFFWLLTLAAYRFYVNRPGVRRYLLLVLALGLGLLAKPMLVTLPLVLLLLDYWPLRRWTQRGFRSLLLEKLPLFVLAGGSCIVTLYAQHLGKAVSSFEETPLSARLANTLVAYASYLGKTFWPVHLAVFYPHPRGSLSAARTTMAGLLLVAITILVLGFARRRPYLAVGWLWYVGTLVPVIGLVQVGGQSMADRYTYVPSIGLFLMLIWSAADLAAEWRLPRWGLAAIGGLTLAACSVLTWFQIGYWQSTIDLWKRATEATENNKMAYTSLAVSYWKDGRHGDAKRTFEQAAAIAPGDAELRNNLGNVYGELGQWDRAAAEFREAIRLDPKLTSPHSYLGNALAHLGQREEAITEYRKAMERDPDDAKPRTALGLQLADLDRLDEAEVELRTALELEPANAEFHSNLGLLLVKRGRKDGAVAAFRRAVDLNPKVSRFHVELGGILQEEGRLDEAVSEYQTALNLGDRQVQPLLQLCARLRALQPRLGGVIAGRDRPADAGEQLGFAVLCGLGRQPHYALAARLYSEAFRADPRLADDARNGHRFQAAAAAAAAGCGRDASPLDDKEKAKLRQQALQWLRAELNFSSRLAQSGRPEFRAAAGQLLRRWQHDARLAGVRDPAPLAQLPKTEQREWRSLWSEVAAILSQVDRL